MRRIGSLSDTHPGWQVWELAFRVERVFTILVAGWFRGLHWSCLLRYSHEMRDEEDGSVVTLTILLSVIMNI